MEAGVVSDAINARLADLAEAEHAALEAAADGA